MKPPRFQGKPKLLVETIAGVVACPDCGAVAPAKDRRPVWVRDLLIDGRPVVVCWHTTRGEPKGHNPFIIRTAPLSDTTYLMPPPAFVAHLFSKSRRLIRTTRTFRSSLGRCARSRHQAEGTHRF